MARLFLLLFMLFAPTQPVLAADALCDEEVLYWQDMCLEFGLLPEEDCRVDDLCLEEEGEDQQLEGARIEVPEDTPKGYQEQIYIVP